MKSKFWFVVYILPAIAVLIVPVWLAYAVGYAAGFAAWAWREFILPSAQSGYEAGRTQTELNQDAAPVRRGLS